jgi:hypothetical protein
MKRSERSKDVEQKRWYSILTFVFRVFIGSLLQEKSIWTQKSFANQFAQCAWYVHSVNMTLLFKPRGLIVALDLILWAGHPFVCQRHFFALYGGASSVCSRFDGFTYLIFHLQDFLVNHNHEFPSLSCHGYW